MRLFRRHSRPSRDALDQDGRLFDGDTVLRPGERTWADILAQPTQELPGPRQPSPWPARKRQPRP